MDIVLASVLSLAVVYDICERRIPNALTVGGLVAALALRLLMDPALALAGLMGAGLGLLVAVPFFVTGAFGAGDAKLLVTVGAFLGVDGFPMALLVTTIVGGFMAAYVSWRSGVLLQVLFHAKDLAVWCLTFGRAGTRRQLSAAAVVTVPYGPAIAVGASFAWAMGAALP